MLAGLAALIQLVPIDGAENRNPDVNGIQQLRFRLLRHDELHVLAKGMDLFRQFDDQIVLRFVRFVKAVDIASVEPAVFAQILHIRLQFLQIHVLAPAARNLESRHARISQKLFRFF